MSDIFEAIYQHNRRPSAQTRKMLTDAKKQMEGKGYGGMLNIEDPGMIAELQNQLAAEGMSYQDAPTEEKMRHIEQLSQVIQKKAAVQEANKTDPGNVIGNANDLYQANRLRHADEKQGSQLNSGPKRPVGRPQPRDKHKFDNTWLDPKRDQNKPMPWHNGGNNPEPQGGWDLTPAQQQAIQQQVPAQASGRYPGEDQHSGLWNWWKDKAEAVDKRGRNVPYQNQPIAPGNNVESAPAQATGQVPQVVGSPTASPGPGGIPLVYTGENDGTNMTGMNHPMPTSAPVVVPPGAGGGQMGGGGGMPMGGQGGGGMGPQMDPMMDMPIEQQEQMRMAAVYDQVRQAQEAQQAAAYRDRLNPFGAGSGYSDLQRPRR